MTSPQCDEMGCLLSDLLAGELEPSAASGVAEHLAGCARCQGLAETFTRQDLMIAEVAGQAQLESMADRLHRALAVRSGTLSRATGNFKLAVPGSGPRRHDARRKTSWVWTTVGLAASLFIVLGIWLFSQKGEQQAHQPVVIGSSPVVKRSPPTPVEKRSPTSVAVAPKTEAPAPIPEVAKPKAEPVAVLAQLVGDVEVLDDSGATSHTPAKTGDQLYSGQGLLARGDQSSAVIQYPDMTTLQLAPGTRVLRLTVSDGKKLVLEQGVVSADVTPQPRNLPMILTTPKAEAVVLGTKLKLTSGEDTASLLVEKGRVRFVRQIDGKAVEVPQGHYAVVAKDVEFAVRPVTPSNPRQVVLREHTAAVTSVAFSPDGRFVATASNDTTIIIWNTASRTVRATLKGHTAPVEAVAFSPDGQTLASASWDQTIRLWDMETCKLKKTLEGHSGTVFALAFSRDGKTLASGSSDRTIRLWRLPTGKDVSTITVHSGAVRSVAFAPHNKFIASGGADGAGVTLDLGNGNRHDYKHGTNWVYRLEFTPDEKMLVTGCGDGSVHVWDVDSGTERHRLTGHTQRITGLTMAPGSQELASSSMDGTIRFWDLTTGNETRRLSGEPLGEVSGMAFARDGSTLAIGNWDGSVVFWDLTKGMSRE
jgi:hypothetical protein